MNYTLAVVIPNWNGENFLPVMLNSIMRQDFEDYKVFVVDDLSNDNSVNIIKDVETKTDKIFLVIRDRLPKGGQTCRNIGYEMTKGAKYVMFLDNDDVIAPFCFRQRVEFMNEHPNLDMAVFPAITFVENIDDTDRPTVFGIRESSDTLHDMFDVSSPLPMVGWTNIYRRGSYERLNLYWDENVPVLQDSDMNITSLIKGIHFDFAYNINPKKIYPDYFYRVGNNRNGVSQKMNNSKYYNGYVYLINKFYAKLSVPQRKKYSTDLKFYVLFLCNFMSQATKSEIQKLICNPIVARNRILFIKLRLWLIFHSSYILKMLFIFERHRYQKKYSASRLRWKHDCNELINKFKTEFNEGSLYSSHINYGGGATLSFLNLVEQLRNKGVGVTIVTPDINPEFLKRTNEIGARVIVSPVWNYCIPKNHSCIKTSIKIVIVLLHRLLYELRHGFSFLRLCKIIKNEKPDIIHTNTGVVHDGFWAARRYNIPHIWHLREYQDRDFDWHVFPTKRLFSMMLKKSYVISITKDVLKNFQLQEDAFHRVIYNGVMGHKNQFFSIPKELYFLCASRVSPEKGHLDVIKAFSLFHKCNPNYRLKILGFGDENYIRLLKSTAHKLDSYDSIDFIGYTSDVSSFMKKAKALIVASKFEGFGRMTAEAFFNGCMVIGRNTGGTKEIFDLTGGIPYEGDYKVLENKMEEVVNMSEKAYSEIVLNGQRIACDYFSNEANANYIYEFYCDVLHSYAV